MGAYALTVVPRQEEADRLRHRGTVTTFLA
jgi:hypothetical protein